MSILVGFAPTPEGRAAVRRGIAECVLRKVQLILVSSERAGADPIGVAQCQQEIAQACAELGVRDPGHEVHLFTGSVEPADDVLTVAEDTGAELIVIGLRRRTPVGKLILGGSAQRILLEAHCPVLAVKGASAASVRVDTTANPAVRPAREADVTLNLGDAGSDRLPS